MINRPTLKTLKKIGDTLVAVDKLHKHAAMIEVIKMRPYWDAPRYEKCYRVTLFDRDDSIIYFVSVYDRADEAADAVDKMGEWE